METQRKKERAASTGLELLPGCSSRPHPLGLDGQKLKSGSRITSASSIRWSLPQSPAQQWRVMRFAKQFIYILFHISRKKLLSTAISLARASSPINLPELSSPSPRISFVYKKAWLQNLVVWSDPPLLPSFSFAPSLLQLDSLERL